MNLDSALALDGELTAPYANAQRERLLNWVEQAAPRGGQHLQLDLAAIAEMDTAGAQLLLALAKELRGRGAELAIVNPSHAVAGVLATYRLHAALRLAQTQGAQA